jgi:hypothetical protein
MTTRFIGVAGYVDKPSRDGRTLNRLPAGTALSGPSLMPLLTLPVPGTTITWREPVGRIDHVGMLGDQIILTGIILEDWCDSEVIRDLRTGVRCLGLDVDRLVWDSAEPTVLEADDVPQTFTSWRIRAATVHSSPVWDMPPVMIWTED